MAISARTKYPNLKFLISEKKYSQKQIAESIGITPRTFCKKLQGIYSFTLDEAFIIQNTLFPEIRLENLFSTVTNYAIY